MSGVTTFICVIANLAVMAQAVKCGLFTADLLNKDFQWKFLSKGWLFGDHLPYLTRKYGFSRCLGFAGVILFFGILLPVQLLWGFIELSTEGISAATKAILGLSLFSFGTVRTVMASKESPILETSVGCPVRVSYGGAAKRRRTTCS